MEAGAAGAPPLLQAWTLSTHPPALLACLQVQRARECEANTGPAQRPDLAAAGTAGGEGGEEAEEEEVDPLDAFMAEIGQVEAAAAQVKPKPRQERMEAEDTVEAYVQVGGWARGWVGKWGARVVPLRRSDQPAVLVLSLDRRLLLFTNPLGLTQPRFVLNPPPAGAQAGGVERYLCGRRSGRQRLWQR